MPLFGAAWCGTSWDVGRAVSPTTLAGKEETIKWLRSQGCSPDHQDSKGITPKNVCDMSYWMKPKDYKKAKQYEPPICARLKSVMNAP